MEAEGVGEAGEAVEAAVIIIFLWDRVGVVIGDEPLQVSYHLLRRR